MLCFSLVKACVGSLALRNAWYTVCLAYVWHVKRGTPCASSQPVGVLTHLRVSLLHVQHGTRACMLGTGGDVCGFHWLSVCY